MAAPSEAHTRRELAHLERLLITWPCSVRLKRRITEERARLARIEASRGRTLRGQILRGLKNANEATLAELARVLEAS